MSHEEEEAKTVERILQSPSYRLAYKDIDFLSGPRLRPARMELELLKPEIAFEDENIASTIVVFGGTRIVQRAAAEKRLAAATALLAETPDDTRRQRDVVKAERILAKSHYYDIAREFGRLVSSTSQSEAKRDYVIVTGGGPGIMEAGNRGAYDVGAKSVGLNIKLPMEQRPNPYITPNLCFHFHYFALRKLHFLLRAKGLVVFPGGYGTLDELFDTLTLRQTGRMQDVPIIMFGREFWKNVIDFQYLADEGTIDDRDLNLITYAETAQEAWDIITAFHAL